MARLPAILASCSEFLATSFATIPKIPSGVNFMMNRVIFIITSKTASKKVVSGSLYFASTFVIKKPKITAKKITERIEPCAIASTMLSGINR